MELEWEQGRQPAHTAAALAGAFLGGAGSGLLSGGGSSDRRDSCRTLRSGNRVLGG